MRQFFQSGIIPRHEEGEGFVPIVLAHRQIFPVKCVCLGILGVFGERGYGNLDLLKLISKCSHFFAAGLNDCEQLRIIGLFRGLVFARNAAGVDVPKAQAWAGILAEPDGTGASRARAILTVGTILRASSQAGIAATLFEEAIKIAPDEARAHYLLALVRKEQNRNDDALRSLEEAVRLDPALIEAHINLGILLAGAGRRAQALDHFRAAVLSAPRNANAFFNLGVALLPHLGQLDEAIKNFRVAVELQPGYREAERALDAALYTRQELQNRMEEWRSYVRREPGNANAHYSLGVVYSQLGRHRDAAQAFQSALRVQPGHRAAVSNLAVTYFALGRYDQARDAANRLNDLGGTPSEGFLRALDAAERDASTNAVSPEDPTPSPSKPR